MGIRKEEWTISIWRSTVFGYLLCFKENFLFFRITLIYPHLELNDTHLSEFSKSVDFQYLWNM